MTRAGARVLHLSPDAGAVDVFASSSAPGVDPVKLIPGFEYTQQFPGDAAYANSGDGTYAKIPAGESTFDVVVPAAGISMASDTAYSATLPLAAGVEYSVIALGNAADGLTGPGNGTEFGLLPIVDDNRPLADLARVKILHGTPDGRPGGCLCHPGRCLQY